MRVVHKCPFPEGGWQLPSRRKRIAQAQAWSPGRARPGGAQGLTEEEVQVLVVVGQVSALLPAVLWRQVALGGQLSGAPSSQAGAGSWLGPPAMTTLDSSNCAHRAAGGAVGRGYPWGRGSAWN